jgi:hypothetical protein
VASDTTIGFVLEFARAARMVAQHAVDPSLPGLQEVIDRLTKAVFSAPVASPYEAEVRRSEQRVLVDRLIWMATAAPNGQVRAIASLKLSNLAARLKGISSVDESEMAQNMLVASDIKRFLERPAETTKMIAPEAAPPGAPIGGDTGMDWLAPVPMCTWTILHPDWWSWGEPPM